MLENGRSDLKIYGGMTLNLHSLDYSAIQINRASVVPEEDEEIKMNPITYRADFCF
jgi:hypothetical protein